MEADLVAHCGANSEGPFHHTLVLTDVATGWTECLALLRRTEADILQALTTVRQLFPFRLIGMDTDNGSEFMHYGLRAYCERETIQFTRGRARRKNDQCFVEQKTAQSSDSWLATTATKAHWHTGSLPSSTGWSDST